MIGNKELDELSKAFLKSLEDDDPFGLNEEIITTEFKCRECQEVDDVPDFVVTDFQIDLGKGEEVEIELTFRM